MKVLPENPLLRCAFLLVRRYLRHSVGIQSAALAFYLLFMLFPFLIFISSLLGLLQLDTAAVLRELEGLLPHEVVELAGVYLRHVGENASVRLLLFGLVFSVWFPMRAANTLMRSVRTAYRLGPPRRAIVHTLKALAYTGMLILSVALTLMLLSVSGRFLERLGLPEAVAELWQWLRFPLVAAAGFFALFFLYALAQDRHRPWRELWPGTLAALAAWLALSWAYSWYVENIAHYSLLYGSIGAIVVLLIWLYLSAAVLIMGAELNAVVIGLRKEEKER